VAEKKASGVRAVFLIIFGFIFIGIGASLYYGELGFGSLTNHGVGQQSANPSAYLPIGLGVVLMVAGFVLAIFDRRAT
jgi:hypothetical protein